MDKITKKADLLAYMRAHPERRLQLCFGVRGHRWFWIRYGTETQPVHARAAQSLIDGGFVKRANVGTFRDRDYVLTELKTGIDIERSAVE